MTHVDSLQVGGAVTSVTAAAASIAATHPLQIVTWIVAIAAGVFSIYRGVMAERRRVKEHEPS